MLDIGNNEEVLVYKINSNKFGLGGSANSDIKLALETKYGPEDTVVEVYTGKWNGRDVVITDKVRVLEINYLGEQFQVGGYAECRVVIDRNAYDLNTKEFISTATRKVEYIAFDDSDPLSEERARLLEDTLEEKYIGNQHLFQINE